jgi:3-oxoacyl-[acyl-carrier protein] reductase
MMDLGLDGKVALVTGGSSGLGFGAAKALFLEGVSVILLSRSNEKLARATEELQSLRSGDQPTITTIQANLDSPTAAAGVVDALRADGTSPDILIANSGGPKGGGYLDVTTTDLQEALNGNFLAMAELVRLLTPDMVEREWGRVVAITSLWVRQPSPTLILSNAARSALTAYLKTAASELASFGVTINTVQPGLHLTDRLRTLYGGNVVDAAAGLPSKSLGDADDFGKVVAFLCSRAARYINGVSLPVDGGLYQGLL